MKFPSFPRSDLFGLTGTSIWTVLNKNVSQLLNFRNFCLIFVCLLYSWGGTVRFVDFCRVFKYLPDVFCTLEGFQYNAHRL